VEADAEYFDFSNPPSSVKNGIDKVEIGVAIDDPVVDLSGPPNWGAYQASHQYSVQYLGLGGPISATFYDGAYYNNSGSISVEILEYK